MFSKFSTRCTSIGSLPGIRRDGGSREQSYGFDVYIFYWRIANAENANPKKPLLAMSFRFYDRKWTEKRQDGGIEYPTFANSKEALALWDAILATVRPIPAFGNDK